MKIMKIMEKLNKWFEASNDDLCGKCHWRKIGRFQKCSCCKRNSKMKDNYKPAEVESND